MEGIPCLRAIDVTDGPEVWAGMGFAVDGTGRCHVGGVAFRLGAETRDGRAGLVGWAVDGAPDLAELPQGAPEPAPSGPAEPERGPAHPNGAVGVDHVVVNTPDLDRTISAFEAAGVSLRRVRDAGPGVKQAFFRLGPVIVEVVGGPAGYGNRPAALWGLAFTVADLDATASMLGDRLRPSRPAVQPGRRIATLDRSAGSAVPIAFMTATPGR